MADLLTSPVIDWSGGAKPQSSGGTTYTNQHNQTHAIGFPVYTVPLINNVGFLNLAPTAATTQAFPIE